MLLPKSQSESMQIPARNFIQEVTPALLSELTEESPRQWGKMSPQHMVEHVSSLFYISRKDMGLPCFVPEDRIEKAQSFLTRPEKMFRQGTVAPMLPKEPEALKFDSLDAAKDVFLKSIEKFYGFYLDPQHQEAPQIMHPAFGKLNLELWEIFHQKHIVHHFAQFGLMQTDMSAKPKTNA